MHQTDNFSALWDSSCALPTSANVLNVGATLVVARPKGGARPVNMTASEWRVLLAGGHKGRPYSERKPLMGNICGVLRVAGVHNVGATLVVARPKEGARSVNMTASEWQVLLAGDHKGRPYGETSHN